MIGAIQTDCYNSAQLPPWWGLMERGGVAIMQMPQQAADTGERQCPWCGSVQTRLIQRGYTGPTDEVDQYFSCATCGKLTYELIAKNAREMRMERYRAGGVYKDLVHKTKYTISRILKVGVNEFLIYLKPMPEEEPAAAIRPVSPSAASSSGRD